MDRENKSILNAQQIECIGDLCITLKLRRFISKEEVDIILTIFDGGQNKLMTLEEQVG